MSRYWLKAGFEVGLIFVIAECLRQGDENRAQEFMSNWPLTERRLGNSRADPFDADEIRKWVKAGVLKYGVEKDLK